MSVVYHRPRKRPRQEAERLEPEPEVKPKLKAKIVTSKSPAAIKRAKKIALIPRNRD